MRALPRFLLSALGIMAPAAPATQAVAPLPRSPFPMADFGETAAVGIDGEQDAAWDAVPPVDDFTEYRPRQGEPASVRTEVRFARDSRYVYVLARMFDPDITRLRAGLARRDNFSNEQDWISIALDPVGSRRMAQLFYFNPDGVIWDGLLNEDTSISTPFADFEVDVATRVQPDSWVVELRIPFDELRYASRTSALWHVLIRRNYPRGERHAMAAPAIPATSSCFMCLAAPIAPPGVLPSPRAITVVPHLMSVGSREQGEWRSEFEPSLDAKWRLSPATVLDAALNPDFSQVDLDTPQLASNRQFAVSFPEKRPFFLEGIDMFDSPLTAIYTRSITDPAWGVRATHRGSWDGTLLTSLDDGGGFVVLPGSHAAQFLPQDFESHATLGRVRKPLGNLTLGALLTDRRTDGGYNTVAGPDLTWRLSPTTRLGAQWLTSRTRGGDGLPGPPDRSSGDAFSVDLLHESPRWHATLQLQELDEDFRADNGYIPQVGIRSAAAELRYKITTLPKIAELAPYVEHDSRETRDGERVSAAPRAGVITTLTSNLVLTTEWRPQERLRVSRGGELHELAQGYLALTTYPGGQLPVLTLSATVGDAVDFATDRAGEGETLGVSLLWRPLARLEVAPGFDFTTVRVARDEVRESAAQLLATLHLSARERFRLIAQRVAVHRDSGAATLRDDSRLVGSLLFTHERSLTRRLYAGVSWSRVTSLPSENRDSTEIFVKLQWGLSSARDFR